MGPVDLKEMKLRLGLTERVLEQVLWYVVDCLVLRHAPDNTVKDVAPQTGGEHFGAVIAILVTKSRRTSGANEPNA